MAKKRLTKKKVIDDILALLDGAENPQTQGAQVAPTLQEFRQKVEARRTG